MAGLFARAFGDLGAEACKRYERTNKPTRFRKGDLVEIARANYTYSHWAVYIGKGRVIHFSYAAVREDRLESVKRGDPAAVNNEEDKNMKPLNPNEIVKRAKKMLGKKGYNPAVNNCEHFANNCRYGVSKSSQFDKTARALLVPQPIAEGLQQFGRLL